MCCCGATPRRRPCAPAPRASPTAPTLRRAQFAFLSYAEPAAAAAATHFLDGCRIAELAKDGGGITVEAENGEGP